MAKTKQSGSFLICLLFHMLLNLSGLIPAALLLVLHYVLDWSIWWSIVAAIVWLIGIILWMCIIGWAGKCSNSPEVPQMNKNPYSAKTISQEGKL